MDLARQLEAADSYIDLDRKDAKAQWAKIKEENPRKFFLCPPEAGAPMNSADAG